MRFPDIVKTSNSNLRRSKLRTFLTLLAISIGTFTLALSLGLGQGLRNYISSELGQYKGVNLYQVQKSTLNDFSGIGNHDPKIYDPNKSVSSAGFENNFLSSADISEIKNTKGVASLELPYAATFLYATAPDTTKYEASNSTYLSQNPVHLVYGENLTSTDPGYILLSQKYIPLVGANNAKNAIGKNLQVTYKNFAGKIYIENFKVKGIYEPSLVQAPIIVNRSDAERIAILQAPSGVPVFNFAFISKKDSITDAQFKTNLKNNKYTARSFADINNTLNNIITGVQVSLAAFSGIAILASIVGVINTLFMSVLERTREIGLFRALGSKRRTIFALFSVEAALLGFWGGVIGIVLAFGAQIVINRIAANTFLKGVDGIQLLNIKPSLVVFIIVIISLITWIAGLLPAFKASRVDPIESLRYE
jgi:putative ABC transport system permease protein